MIYCLGGASHFETYDIKPDGPEQMRSIFRPIASRVPGMAVCELLPLHAAKEKHTAAARYETLM